MREIKFRAWLKEWKKYYNVLSVSFDSKKIVINAGHNFHHILDFNEVILEQYTGLKDKNGVEIYEGDIVCNEYGLFDKERNEVVEYTTNGTRNGVEYTGYMFYYVLKKLVVLGNIHENQELLKKGE